MTNFDEDLLISQRVDESLDQPVLHQVLRIAIYDEYHAYNAYRKTIDTFGNVKPFTNIMESEIRHYNILAPLLEKYNVQMPIDNWYEKIELPNTIQECCELGVVAEIENIKMYDDLLLYTGEYPDVQDVLFRVQAASYNNHLPAFRNCVARYSNDGVKNFKSEDMTAKINEFSQMAQKFQTGQMSQDDMLKLLGNTNLSFLGGVMLGGIGAAILPKLFENK